MELIILLVALFLSVYPYYLILKILKLIIKALKKYINS